MVGLDSSADMIRFALECFPAGHYANLSFVQQDAAAIGLEGKFDVAFSSAALHWVADHPAVLRGVRNSLREGGSILFQMGGRGNAAELFGVLQSLLDSPRWSPFFAGFQAPYHFHGTEEYERWLPQGGFRPRRIELIAKVMQHPGREGLKGWLRTTWFPYTDRLPAELREEFLEELVAAYLLVRPLDAAGNTQVRMVRLEVEAAVS